MIEFQGQLNADRTVTVPANVVDQVPAGQTFRVVIVLEECADEEQAWSRMAAVECLKGHAEADAAYDLPEPRWARFVGRWQPDDPLIEEWEREVAEYRRKMDEDPNIPCNRSPALTSPPLTKGGRGGLRTVKYSITA